MELLLAYIHELGHFLSAKLIGLSPSLTVSQRFVIFLVFECKLNEVWLLNKKERIFPMLGGIMMDNLVVTLVSIITLTYDSSHQILYTILFIQCSKLIYQLLIPFKTDLYYLVLFYFQGTKIGPTIMKFLYLLGYVFLIPFTLIYLYQVFNLIMYTIEKRATIQFIIIMFLFIIPIFLTLYERRHSHD